MGGVGCAVRVYQCVPFKGPPKEIQAIYNRKIQNKHFRKSHFVSFLVVVKDLAMFDLKTDPIQNITALGDFQTQGIEDLA